MALSAFPDLDMKILHLVGEGDVVIAYGRFMGTHHGEFMGIPATRRTIDVPFADVVRFREDGLAAEHWGVADSGMMMQQLGLAPGPSE
jgi:predicted ester cyclase